MSKLRRNNICSSPRNRNKVSNNGFSEFSTNDRLKKKVIVISYAFLVGFIDECLHISLKMISNYF